ncbi:phage holin [Staphylococcus saprophyticus]|nr:phage holin [Staphylococcus saprophyticus]MDW4034551.1 phage holin [Staphylococcus saprophyticus]MDW4184654.1 phage holin [Staphylococcus saprophyticus]
MNTGTIVRTIILALAWINQILAINHISPIPIDEVTISSVITGLASLWTWWKNNNFTHAAKEADNKLKELKYQKKLPTNGKAPSNFDADKDGQI